MEYTSAIVAAATTMKRQIPSSGIRNHSEGNSTWTSDNSTAFPLKPILSPKWWKIRILKVMNGYNITAAALLIPLHQVWFGAHLARILFSPTHSHLFILTIRWYRF